MRRAIVAAGLVALSALPASAAVFHYPFGSDAPTLHEMYGTSSIYDQGSFDLEQLGQVADVACSIGGFIPKAGMIACVPSTAIGIINLFQPRQLERQYAGRSRRYERSRVVERPQAAHRHRVVARHEPRREDVAKLREELRREIIEDLQQEFILQKRVTRTPVPRTSDPPSTSEEIRPRFQHLTWVAPQPALLTEAVARASYVEPSAPTEKKVDVRDKPWYEVTPEELKEIRRAKRAKADVPAPAATRKAKWTPEFWYSPGHPKAKPEPKAPEVRQPALSIPVSADLDTRAMLQHAVMR